MSRSVTSSTPTQDVFDRALMPGSGAEAVTRCSAGSLVIEPGQNLHCLVVGSATWCAES